MKSRSQTVAERRIAFPVEWLASFALLIFIPLNLFGEVFPVKTYTTADGLLRDEATEIKQDSRGFLWFCTPGGLSLFDGYAFTNYTMNDGLPAPPAYDLIETSDGTIWISNNEGLIKFNPSGLRQKFDKNNPANPDSMFQVFAPSEEKNDKWLGELIEDENKIIWAATQSGLLRIEVKDCQPIFSKTEITFPVLSLNKDSKGNLWIGSWEKGLFLKSPDGKFHQFTDEHGLPQVSGKYPMTVTSIFEDKVGRIWIGGRAISNGICRLVENPKPNEKIVENCYTEKDGLSSDWITSLFQSSDGTIWIGTVTKLTQLTNFDEKGKPIFRILDSENGFNDSAVNDVLEDRDGNIWMAATNGIQKLSKQGFTQYGVIDGLSSTTNISSILQTTNSELIVTDHPNERNISVFRNGKFTAIKPNYPNEIDYWGWGGKHTVLQTRDGEWWVTTGSSQEFQKKYGLKANNAPILIRFPKVENIEDLANVSPKKIYHTSDAPNLRETFQIYEDRNRDIWMMGFGEFGFLYRWDRKTDKFIDCSEKIDLRFEYFQTFAEDSSGNLWIGGSVSKKSNPNERIQLVRYKDGVFQVIELQENFTGTIYDLFVDSKSRLWAATSRNGLAMLEDVTAEKPKFVFYGTAEGLSDNTILTVTEDKFGRIYAGSGRGVDQINLKAGKIIHFTTNDGLPSGEINLSKTDKTGSVWFASATGVASFIPEVDKPRQTPNIYISGLRVAGVSQKISELGETDLPNSEFTADKNNLTIEYLGLGASLGENLKYQYQLGDENSEWMTTNERSLNFANLSAGDYQFAVRAVSSDGLMSPNPATFSFQILRPIYLRWWFLTLAALLIGLAIRQIYRLRVGRLLEIERTRTRIATDLHDDIGSDLSKISLLSEVVKMQMQNGSEENNRLLTTIAETSRKSVDSMRDIVWAINPSRDSFNDLVKKMRQFAEETLVEKNIKINFNAPADNQKLKLSMNMRRELYLIFKEAVSNAAKYSKCSKVEIDFAIIGKEISLQIKDDGKGFDVSQDFDGNGLKNMKRRCENLKGKFEITSSQEHGTNTSAKFLQG